MLPPLRLRADIPRQGARAYSIGFPLNLGLTITEGVANGLVDTGFDQRIHYTGAINGGMSGGPALDAGGGVYGVNVSVVTGRQLVGFVVPARHIEPLLKRAQAPSRCATWSRSRRWCMRSSCSSPGRRSRPRKPCSASRCPAAWAGLSTAAPRVPAKRRRGCRWNPSACFARAGVLLQLDLEVGRVEFQHRVLRAQGLKALQFSQRLNDIAESAQRSGSARNVAPFACRDALVSLDGFDARISTCARQYRLFTGLYDIAVTVTSINSTETAVVSQLDLRGVGFEPRHAVRAAFPWEPCNGSRDAGRGAGRPRHVQVRQRVTEVGGTIRVGPQHRLRHQHR